MIKRVLKVGDTIWNQSGHPLKIVGETARSWLMELDNEWSKQVKAPKKAPPLTLWMQWFYTEEDRDKVLFARAHRHSISRAVEAVTDGDVLRKIAVLIGWKEPEPKK